MQLVIDPGGGVLCVYSDDMPLAEFGRLSISRGSHVEPSEAGHWTADLSPVGGPLLGPFATRSEALSAERAWLEHNWTKRGLNTDKAEHSPSSSV